MDIIQRLSKSSRTRDQSHCLLFFRYSAINPGFVNIIPLLAPEILKLSAPILIYIFPWLRAHTYHLLSITVISRLPLSRTKNGYPSCNEYNRFFRCISIQNCLIFRAVPGPKLLVTPNRRPLPAFCIFIRFSYFSLNLKILSFFFGGLLPSILSGMGS